MAEETGSSIQHWGWMNPQTGELIGRDDTAGREFIDSIPRAKEYLSAQAERMRDGPPTITLMPEYSIEVPLWPQEDETDALVSEGLMARLMAWQDVFAVHFDADTRSGQGGSNRPTPWRLNCVKR
jgi:hypothetical protein